jgi:hypothetical protein
MSTLSPIIPLISKPVGMDKAIQRLQKYIGTGLPWLTYSFGRATIGKSKGAGEKDKIRTAPEVYMGDGRYEVVEPNNQWVGHSFIQVPGAERPVNFKPGQINDYSTTLELVVLVDLEQVKEVMGYTYTHHFTEELKEEVRNVLRKLPQYQIVAIHESPGEVLRGYSYDHYTHQTFRHPKAGFKFVLEVSYSECC